MTAPPWFARRVAGLSLQDELVDLILGGSSP
jgi:hypothetical protein